jgi:hypothetical protein
MGLADQLQKQGLLYKDLGNQFNMFKYKWKGNVGSDLDKQNNTEK